MDPELELLNWTSTTSRWQRTHRQLQSDSRPADITDGIDDISIDADCLSVLNVRSVAVAPMCSVLLSDVRQPQGSGAHQEVVLQRLQ